MNATAKEIGQRIGQAIARDVIADKLPREWPGLNDQDGDQLTAAGIEPGSDDWQDAESAAEHTYVVLVRENDSLADQYAEHDMNRADRWIS